METSVIDLVGPQVDWMPWQGAASLAAPLLFLLLLGISCWAWGEALLRIEGLRLEGRRLVGLRRGGPGPTGRDPAGAEDPTAERWATAATLGLGVLGQWLLLLGLLGRLDGPHVLASLLAAHVGAALAGVWTSASGILRRSLPFVLAGAPTIALALYPARGFDASTYHLPYATAFLERGELTFLPQLRFPVFPQLAEMAFVPALMAVGDVGPQLCQALCLVLGGAVTHAWGRRLGGPACGLLAAALWFGLPLAVWIGAQAYVDVQLALFVVAGASAIDRGRAGLGALLLGFGAATKYLGLLFWAGGAAIALVRSRRRRATALVLALAGAVSAGPWYLRLVLLTGNPLFPLYPRLFGDNPWHGEYGILLSSTDDADPVRWVPEIGARLVDLLTLPWTAVVDRERVNFGAPISPWYLVLLVLLPLLLRRVRRERPERLERQTSRTAMADRSLRDWTLLLLAYALFWTTTQGEIRFLLPALALLHPFLALLLARAGSSLLPPPSRRRGAAVAALLLLAPGWAFACRELWQAGAPPMDRQQRHRFLARLVPGYDAIHHLNRRTDLPPGGIYSLRGEHLRHFSRRPFRGEIVGPDRFSAVFPLVRRPEALARYLGERGLRYLLVRSDQRGRNRLESSPRFSLLHAGRDFALFGLDLDRSSGGPDRLPATPGSTFRLD